MYAKELIDKVFNYDTRMSHLRGNKYSNRPESIFYKLNIHYLRETTVNNQDTKIKVIITKIENVVGKIAKLMSDVESSGRHGSTFRHTVIQEKEEYIKKDAEILAKNNPGYSEEHYLEVAEDLYNSLLIGEYHKDAREIIYTVLALSIIDLDGRLRDETRLGDDGIDKELEEITQGIRVLLNIEGWKLFFEFIDHIATKRSIWWFTSQELGFAMRGRVERELLKIETEAKIEEEKNKRVELEKQIEELKQKIKQQPEQKEDLK